MFLVYFMTLLTLSLSDSQNANNGLESSISRLLSGSFQYESGLNKKLSVDGRRETDCVDSPSTHGKGDPHFSGADSSHFDFSGIPNNSYCLISDPHIHVNAYFGGYYGTYGEDSKKPLTWMRKIGILWGHHTVLFEAREGPTWEYEQGYLSNLEVDGESVKLLKSGDSFTFESRALTVTWEASRKPSGDDFIDVFGVEIKRVANIVFELRPDLENFRTLDDGTVHFDIYFPEIRLSKNAHGVLGQTFRSDHKNRLSNLKLEYNEILDLDMIPGNNGEGYLDGNVADYQVSSILSSDCKVSRFAFLNRFDPETASAIEESLGNGTMEKVNEVEVLSTIVSSMPRKGLRA